jgi:hypothetical protein
VVHWIRSLATSSEFKAIPPMTTPRPPLAYGSRLHVNALYSIGQYAEH